MNDNLYSVAIVLATYNGEKYIAEQLQSIAQQTHSNWQLIVGDDGSTDGTYQVLQKFAMEYPTTILVNARLGFVENFMSTLFSAENKYDFYLFSDQDDYWDADKIAQGLKALENTPQNIPALYGSRSRLMNAGGDCYSHSQLFKRPLGFRNALVQCFAGGNTMMINRAAWELLRAAKKTPLISHDWWFYQLISGAGGSVVYDPVPRLNYRQHGDTLVGSSAGFSAFLARVRSLGKGVWKNWNDIQVAALQVNASLLTDENRRILDCFAKARKSSMIPRVTGFYASGVYRQTPIGNAGLLAAALFNRM